MKVAQLRKVLESAANQHDTVGRQDLANALRKLADAFKSADKLQVDKLVEALRH